MQIKVILTCLKKNPTEYAIEYATREHFIKTTFTLLNWDSLTLGNMYKKVSATNKNVKRNNK